jgi:hypothetical protein
MSPVAALVTRVSDLDGPTPCIGSQSDGWRDPDSNWGHHDDLGERGSTTLWFSESRCQGEGSLRPRFGPLLASKRPARRERRRPARVRAEPHSSPLLRPPVLYPRLPIAASVRKIVVALAAMVEDAVADKLLERNPARGKRMRVRVPKPDTDTPRDGRAGSQVRTWNEPSRDCSTFTPTPAATA